MERAVGIADSRRPTLRSAEFRQGEGLDALIALRAAFDFSVDQYLYFGGYPGAAPLAGEPNRWRRYILDALVETTIGRDVLLLIRVDKPALLRRLFELGCRYSGQVLSYKDSLLWRANSVFLRDAVG